MAQAAPCTANMACYGRACRGEYYSGDLAYIHEQGAATFLAVVDAAGHGRLAHGVAEDVAALFQSAYISDLAALVQSLHQQLRGGRRRRHHCRYSGS